MDSRRIDSDSTVDMVFHLKWKSDGMAHTDGYQASRINIWRDYIPPSLLAEINGKQAGERFELQLSSNDFFQEYAKQSLFKIKRQQFDPQATPGIQASPAVGRFYPKGILKSVAGVFRANVQPFRLVQVNNGNMMVDFNHPLAGKELVLSGIVGKVENKKTERGGSSVDWMEVLTNGPGMQARWQNQETEFFSSEAFRRDDETPDTLFYGEPRLVQHIDDTAIEMIKNTYGRFLKNDMDVLDLMSSWQSHLPENLSLRRLAGLGLNGLELKQNARLSEHVIQDLNLNPVLPFESDSFDAVVCTVSVEYLTNPLAIFEEVSRVLRTDGYFIVTFSNRWFPTKAIRVWKELHEFERMGMVLEYFLRSGGYKNLQTYSFRGLPRPHADKYFPDLMYSDPVYAVWGQKR
ncbi:methyltransferase domain-containing protein [Thermodesulfobacteriota bacterium]